MSLPETPLGPLKRRDGEPLFDEAWQAQALGIADILVNQGVISADAWAIELGSELRMSAAASVKDDAESYYHAVLSALQTLLYEAGVAREEVDDREDAWRHAYLNTPHGMPVELNVGVLGHDEASREDD